MYLLSSVACDMLGAVMDVVKVVGYLVAGLSDAICQNFLASNSRACFPFLGRILMNIVSKRKF